MGPRHRLDDRTADAVWSGRLPVGSEDLDDVAAFAARLRASVHGVAAPTPSSALAELLETGLPGTVDTRTSRQVGVRGRRTVVGRSIRQGILAKVAGMTLVAKVGLATAAVAITTTGAGFTGALPIPAAQEAFDRAFRTGAVPVEVPDTTDQAPSDADADAGYDQLRSPAGGDSEVGQTPVPGTSSPRDGTSSAREEIPDGIERIPPSDVPHRPDGAEPPEPPRTFADPEQGPDPLRPDRGTVPSEEAPPDQAGNSDAVSSIPPVQRDPEVPARDGPVEGDAPSGLDPAVSSSDAASPNPGPDGPVPVKTPSDQEQSPVPTDPPGAVDALIR